MLRKTILGLLAALCLAGGALAEEASLDEVLAGYYEATGGLDTIKGVKSIRMSGTMAMGQGMESAFTRVVKRPDKRRLEFVFQGMTGIQGFDGEKAWQIMPFMGSPDPQLMTEEEARLVKEDADIDGALVDYQAKGHQLELLGREDIEGTPAYKIKVTLATGDVRYYYLDAEYYLPIRVDGKMTMQGNEVEFEQVFGDYKEVGGLMLAHSMEQRPKGAPAGSGQMITISQVELDVEAPDEQFAMPAPAAPAEGGDG